MISANLDRVMFGGCSASPVRPPRTHRAIQRTPGGPAPCRQPTRWTADSRHGRSGRDQSIFQDFAHLLVRQQRRDLLHVGSSLDSPFNVLLERKEPSGPDRDGGPRSSNAGFAYKCRIPPSSNRLIELLKRARGHKTLPPDRTDDGTGAPRRSDRQAIRAYYEDLKPARLYQTSPRNSSPS